MDRLIDSALTVDKEFLKKERDQLYSDFTIAFWRELFQNSVDAGSTRIEIDIRESEPRRHLGDDTPEKVTNVVFTDNGHGMTAEVLNDVYFRMGRSTKDVGGGSIGGFGRARIMTCFAQESYSILTRDRFVTGDGARFQHGSVEQQVEKLKLQKAALRNPSVPGDLVTLAGVEADLALMTDPQTGDPKWSGDGFPGCRIEVDLDVSPPKNWHGKSGSYENMAKALRNYLSESQLPCEVVINGKSPEEFFEYDDGRLQARKGPVRRVLTIPTADGETQFATVHLSEGKKASYKGKMIVRVSGASMYRKDVTGLEAQVIVEIDPAQSRAALNSNRDGLKGDYDRAVDKLLNELTVDTLTALKDKSTKVQEVEGEKGRIASSAPKVEEYLGPAFSSEELGELEKVTDRSPRITSFEALGNMGLHQDILSKFLEKAYYGDSFLNAYVNDRWDDNSEQYAKLRKLRDQLYEERRKPQWFFENADEFAKSWVLSGLSVRVERARTAWKEEQDGRIKGVHDIYISMESANAKTRAAARRHHPENWNVATGNGKAIRSLLATWTAACHIAMETLYTIRPATADISWTTGFVYSLPEQTHEGDQYRDVATAAQCVYVDMNNLRFLINPVNDDGTLRYSLSSKQDLRRILALAKHEVAHALESYHNETFARILTDLDAALDPEAAYRRMRTEHAAVTAAYAAGKARIHALDGEDGQRPAERLLTLAYGNDAMAAREAMEYAGAGVREVNSDAIHTHVEEPTRNDEEAFFARPVEMRL